MNAEYSSAQPPKVSPGWQGVGAPFAASLSGGALYGAFWAASPAISAASRQPSLRSHPCR